MKPLKYILCAGVAGVIAVSAGGVSAKTIGLIEFESFTNDQSPFTVDLGGVSGSIPDAPLLFMTGSSASTLPDGLPQDFTTHINRTFVGDVDSTTADPINDAFLFKVDPSTTTPGQKSVLDAELTVVTGVNSGIENVVFSLFEADANGNAGAQVSSINGQGGYVASLMSGGNYLLSIMGNLRSDLAATLGVDEATDFGQYDVVMGIFGAPVPLPPAILLFLTGIAAFFGFTGLRRRERSAATA